MKYFSSQYLFAALFSLLLLASCGPSENTIVVEDAPVSTNPSDTSQQDGEPTGPFTQLTLGENQPIHSLDPLFARNNSSYRALQLLYEGLVRYNQEGEIEPAIANEWSVTNGQKNYRFSLKSDLFYHDSNVFANGRGRRLVAADVKKAFERMAAATVPDDAAQLFMNIKGFEPYFSEQQQVMMESERQLSSVSGIKVPNDSTVVFSLVEPDEQFLNKLASPYAVIYPQESAKTKSFKPVGSGPFSFSQQRADSLYILSRFDNYRISGQPKVNRVDIVTSTNQAALLNAMNRGEIQMITELGPQQLSMVLDNSGALKPSLKNKYSLYSNRGISSHHIRHNTNADISEADIAGILATVDNQSLFPNLSANYVELLWGLSQNETSSGIDSLSVTYTDNPFVRSFYRQLSEELADNGITFKMNDSRVRNRNTPLYLDHPLIISNSDERSPHPNTLAIIKVWPQAFTHNKVNNLAFNQLPWWIDLRNVTLPSTNSR